MTAQETDEQLAAHFLAVLRQRSIAAREWQRQADQWKASADREREKNEELKKEADRLRLEREIWAGGPTAGPWWVERPEHADAYIAYGVRGDPSQTYDLMEAYNVDTDYELMASTPVLRDALAQSERHAAELAQALAVCEERVT